MTRPLADKDAMFGLSYCLADVHRRLMELMDMYPGDVPADMVERAAQVFDVMDERLRNG